MNLIQRFLWGGSLLGLATGCHVFSSQDSSSNATSSQNITETAPPNAPLYEGFHWEKIQGAGLRLTAQSNDQIHVVTDASLPGARIERTFQGQKQRSEAIIRIFPLTGSDISSLIPQLKAEPRSETAEPWDETATCAFVETESHRPGVSRYELCLTGEAAQELQKRGQYEPIPSTCGGWGTGNSGIRYFEIFDSHPDRAVFVEIGQEAPLFDPLSIELFDSLLTVKGTLCIGHEVRSFIAEGDTTAYWIHDPSGELIRRYADITGPQAKPYEPIYVELRVQDLGAGYDGFAADYPGIYQVEQIISAAPLPRK